MSDKITPKLSKAEKWEVKRDVKAFEVESLGFVLSFPEYGATVAVAPATYSHDNSPVPWSKAKFMRFAIAWLGEGDIFRKRTGQNQALNLFYLDRVQTAPVEIMQNDYGIWIDHDYTDDIQSMIYNYFKSSVLPVFSFEREI